MLLTQLVLDWFAPLGRGAVAAAPEPPAPPVLPVLPAPAAPRRRARTTAVAPPPATGTLASAGDLLGPLCFRHPQASRELLLGGAVLVGYALARTRRRSIAFSVCAQGLSVRAPTWVTLSAIDDALRHKSDWIVRKLGEARERAQRQDGARILWQGGAVLPYLGAPLVLVLDPAAPVAGQLQSADADAAAPGQRLHIGLPASASAAQIGDAVQAWLMRQALAHFTQRLDHYAPLLAVRWSRLRLSNAQTRWGTAHADGTIRLNWRLLHFRPAVIDYVVAHELSHLRVMDHSPRFWATVGTVVPDYAALRRCLRDEPIPRWDGA